MKGLLNSLRLLLKNPLLLQPSLTNGTVRFRLVSISLLNHSNLVEAHYAVFSEICDTSKGDGAGHAQDIFLV